METTTIVVIFPLNVALTFLMFSVIVNDSPSGRDLAIAVPKSFSSLGKFDEFIPASKVSSLVIVNLSSETIFH